MDDKDKDHHDGSVFVINLLEQMTIFFVEIDLDEHCSNLMTSGSKRCIVSNHETNRYIDTSKGTRGSGADLA
jgi:hypothetical protein